MKILITNPHLFAGGAEKAIIHLAHELSRKGHHVVIATLSLEPENLPRFAADLQYALPSEPLRRHHIKHASDAFFHIYRQLRVLKALTYALAEDFDILNACNFPAYWVPSGNRRNPPLVWTCSEIFGPYGATRPIYDHNPFFRFGTHLLSQLDRHLVRSHVNLIVTCSDLNRKLIQARYGVSAQVAPTGVDYEFFATTDGHAHSRWAPNDTLLLIQVGALIKRKNQTLSLLTLHELKKNMKAKLVIVGDGPDRQNLEAFARRLGISDDVLFTGAVTEERLREIYQAADINLFPVEDQTYGLVPFEALAAGKPSIVSNDSGAGQILGRHGIGYTTDRNVSDLVDKVRYVMANPDEVQELTEKGRRFVKENLSWRSYADSMIRVFETVLENHS